MKTRQSLFIAIAFLFLCGGFASVNAQKAAAPYKITGVKLVPFDQQSGEFQAEITPTDERSFFNEISLGMFVTVEVTGEKGTFEAGRQVEVIVMEGKKQKAKKIEQIGLIGDGGKFYIPVWLDSALCDAVTVKARIIGQKTASTMTRKASFMCGE
ncbi:MAG TPA: hypothetical protein VK308_17580 [Pyrinomonadaceae bacterium]|nr:hypothetical protein [Pyrinomonadaceae bacterium]